MKRNRRSVTIHDVAKAAGVSVSTVSRVLNNKDDVAQDTVEKVQQVIKTLGYASSMAAKSMRSHRTNVIGLVMPDIATPYSIEVMQGVNRAIAQLDYDLLVYTNGDIRKYSTAERERYYVNLLNGSITDGVVVVAAATTNFTTDAPLVIIDPNNEYPDFPAVTSTNREGALAAMKYLTGLGHRRIGFITGRLELLSACHRMLGYKDGLADKDIPVDDELIQIGDYTTETALRCTRTLLSLKNRPTAIFASNDMSAMGVYQAASQAGLRIPEDLSVMGFDNIHDSAHLHPPLTTIDQFISEMATIATEMVFKMIKGEIVDKNLYKIQTQLLIRDSCLPYK
jgi:LacI family transcriptional regulator